MSDGDLTTSEPKSPPKPVGRPPVSEETINRMLDAQTKDQELKAKELGLRQEELQAQAKFADKMLEAQSSDRTDERTHVRDLLKVKLIAAGIFVLIAVVVITLWLYMGKDALAAEVTRMLIATSFGAIGGYGYRAVKEKSRPSFSEDD